MKAMIVQKKKYIYIISGGPVIGVNVLRLTWDSYRAIKKKYRVNLFSKLGWELGLYYASYDDFHLIF